MDGKINGLGTVHPLLTLSFVSTWILPLHVVSSTLKRKSSLSVMDGLQRRREDGAICCMITAIGCMVGATGSMITTIGCMVGAMCSMI